MDIIIGITGGLGLFLFGMTYMGDGLQKAAGANLKKLLATLTNNRFIGVLVGCVVTMIIQSSSATTVMTVGFVNAGLMNLSQAIGIIMGANIGTTITAQLVSLNLTNMAPLFIGIGVAMFMIAKKRKIKATAEIFIGFGILFLGMNIMKDAISPLNESQLFIDSIVRFNNPFIGVLTGFVITAILQSSSATTGLLIALAGSGLITIEMAYPIVFGQNIGTCVTALISSIGANIAARRAAIMHLIFNVFGTIIFLLILRHPVEMLVLKISPGAVERQIANAHTLFNVINVIILFPFASLIVKLSEKLVKGEDIIVMTKLKYVDRRLLATPVIAIQQSSKEVLRMCRMVKQQLIHAEDAIINKNEDAVNDVFEIEKGVNFIEKELLNYIVDLTKTSLNNDERDVLNTIMHTINDIERVGDHADNIAELALQGIEGNITFSEEAIIELKEIFDLAKSELQSAILSFKTASIKEAYAVLEKEKRLNKMEKKLRNSHMDRLSHGKCNAEPGIIFLDTINNLERIGDHSTNIAEYIITVVNDKRLAVSIVEEENN